MSYASEVLADSPLAYLKCDETSGSVLADASGNSRDFTLNGGTLNQATVMPSGLHSVNFNATSENGQKSAASWMNQGQFTVEAWIKPTNVSTFHAIASRDLDTVRGWTLYIWNDGKLAFFDTAGVQHEATTAFTANTAYHVAVTVDNGGSGTTCTVKLYINGTLDSTFTSVNVNNNSASLDMFIGVSRAGSPSPQLFWTLAGNMDEFAYYGTVLSGTRIAAHHTAATTSSVTLGVAGETDTAKTLTRAKIRTLGVTAETDSSKPVTRVKTRTLGFAAETDTALHATISGHLGTAAETDTAKTFGRLKRLTLGVATETDTSHAAAGGKSRTFGVAAETDAARHFNFGAITIPLPLLAFGEFETLTPAAVYLPVLIGADHIEWGYSVFEGEAQGGGP